MSPKESTDRLLQGHLTGIICFGEFTMIQAIVFNLRGLQPDLGHVPEFIQIWRWYYTDYIIIHGDHYRMCININHYDVHLKTHNFPVQDNRKSRVALSIIFVVFTE